MAFKVDESSDATKDEELDWVKITGIEEKYYFHDSVVEISETDETGEITEFHSRILMLTNYALYILNKSFPRPLDLQKANSKRYLQRKVDLAQIGTMQMSPKGITPKALAQKGQHISHEFVVDVDIGPGVPFGDAVRFDQLRFQCRSIAQRDEIMGKILKMRRRLANEKAYASRKTNFKLPLHDFDADDEATDKVEDENDDEAEDIDVNEQHNFKGDVREIQQLLRVQAMRTHNALNEKFHLLNQDKQKPLSINRRPQDDISDDEKTEKD